MLFGINSSYFSRALPDEAPLSVLEAARLCRKAGFEAVDLGSYSEHGDGYADRIRKTAEDIRALGLVIEQTHAPYNRYAGKDVATFSAEMRHAFETAVLLGAKRIVVHGDEYCSTKHAYRSEKAVRYAIEFFSPFVEYALENGLGVAFENVFEDGYRDMPRCCSDVEELIELIDAFGDSRVSCCWDFGHAACAYGAKMLDALKKVGCRLTCTHVHDNKFESDLHLPPYLGKIDWEAHMRYLKELGYEGAFTYEFVYGTLPCELKSSYAALALQTAKHLARVGGFTV